VTAWIRPCSMGNCVEYRRVGGRVEIRDSARQHEVAWFSTAAWDAFVDHLRGSPQNAADAPGVPPHAAGTANASTAPLSPRNHTRVTHRGAA
jgi:hypothetical protein